MVIYERYRTFYTRLDLAQLSMLTCHVSVSLDRLCRDIGDGCRVGVHNLSSDLCHSSGLLLRVSIYSRVWPSLAEGFLHRGWYEKYEKGPKAIKRDTISTWDYLVACIIPRWRSVACTVGTSYLIPSIQHPARKPRLKRLTESSAFRLHEYSIIKIPGKK